jgi:hypothetical protein
MLGLPPPCPTSVLGSLAEARLPFLHELYLSRSASASAEAPTPLPRSCNQPTTCAPLDYSQAFG